MSERRKRIHEANTDFRAGETEDETVVTIETSPAVMPPAWVNFLKQRLHLLHLDCKHVGAGRIVVMSTPHAAESVARCQRSRNSPGMRGCPSRNSPPSVT
jgi:hypothetical protein